MVRRTAKNTPAKKGGGITSLSGEKVPAGTVLYKVLWEGFPPEIATWEEEDQIPCGLSLYVAA